MADVKLAFLFLLIMVTATTVKPQACDSSQPSFINWLNTWKETFGAHCHQGRSLSHWYTFYRLCQGDRLHHFRCTLTPAHNQNATCSWSPFLNAVGQYYFKACANHNYIGGVYSAYDQNTSDRRISLLCCNVPGYIMTNCQATPYQNLFGQPYLMYVVPSGYTLTGVGSYYSSYYKDRRWRFYICQMTPATS